MSGELPSARVCAAVPRPWGQVNSKWSWRAWCPGHPQRGLACRPPAGTHRCPRIMLFLGQCQDARWRHGRASPHCHLIRGDSIRPAVADCQGSLSLVVSTPKTNPANQAAGAPGTAIGHAHPAGRDVPQGAYPALPTGSPVEPWRRERVTRRRRGGDRAARTPALRSCPPRHPTTTVSGSPAAASSTACRRGRGTYLPGSAGTKNFVAARSRSVKILPRVHNHPKWGDSHSLRLILGSE